VSAFALGIGVSVPLLLLTPITQRFVSSLTPKTPHAQRFVSSLTPKSPKILNLRLLALYQSRGAVGHAVSDIRHCVTNCLQEGGYVGLERKNEFYHTWGTSLIRKRTPPWTLQQGYAYGPRGFLRGWAFSYGRGTPVRIFLALSVRPACARIFI